MPHDGGCECGKVRYRLTDTPIMVNCCHCRDCQKITGSAFALNAMVENDRIEWLSSERPVEMTLRSESGESRAWRCPTCAALLFADHPMMKDHIRFIRVGTLDEGERLPPDAHFFVRSKHPWINLPDDVLAYETLPPDGDDPALPPERAVRLQDALRA